MLDFIKPTILGLSLLPSYKLENKAYHNDLVLVPYESPTLNYDPMENYSHKQYQDIMDQIFINEVKRDLLDQ